MPGTDLSSGAVVWLRGEHDIANVGALLEAMDRAIARDDADLVVDLSDVDFMSASTVGALVRTRKLLRLRSRSMVLRAPSASAQRILDLCGLAELFGSPGSALKSWVAVPATDPVDRAVDASSPGPDRAYPPQAEVVPVMAERRGP